MLLVTPVLHTHAFYIHAVLFSPVISSADPPGSDWDESKDACSVKVVVMNVLANGCRLSNRKTQAKLAFSWSQVLQHPNSWKSNIILQCSLLWSRPRLTNCAVNLLDVQP